MLRNPTHRIFICCHSLSLACEFSVAVRNIVRELAPLTGLDISKDQRARDHWVNTAGGALYARGIGGSFSGLGADFIVVDDAVKDMAAACSATQRASLETYMRSELLTRLEPRGKIVCVLARRHPLDLVNFLLEQNKELAFKYQWHYVYFPALSFDANNQPHALWPERYSVEKLLSIEHEHALTGQTHLWHALYQNTPTGDPSALDFPPEYFTDILYDEILYQRRLRVLAVDPSKGKDAKVGDYSAIVVVDITADGTFYVVDSVMKRLNTEMCEDMLVSALAQYQPDACLIESNGFQEIIARNVIEKARRRGIPAPVHSWTNVENKVVRIRTRLTPLLAQKRLRLHNTIDNHIILNQLRNFPLDAHNDGPDALDLAVRMYDRLTKGIPAPQPKVLSV